MDMSPIRADVKSAQEHIGYTWQELEHARENEKMTEEDPAEEYFRILERLMEDTIESRVLIANAREDYRRRSQYTSEYFRQREEYLKDRAHKRQEQKNPGVHKVLRRLFSRRPKKYREND